MKKRLFLAILMSITSLAGLMGQSAKKSLNYQAVILDPKVIDIPGADISGQPLSKGKVCLKFTFLNALGNVDYEETQQATTDEYGLVSLSIGTGSYSSGTYENFERIVWDANVKSIEVAVSYEDCKTFKKVSTQTLNYTAYALYAEAVDYKNVRDTPTKLSQFINDPGFLIPKDLEPIKADIQTNTLDIKSNTSQIAMANQTIADNKMSSDAAFLTVNAKLNDQQNQISDNRHQIYETNNNLNNQIGGLQGQINNVNSVVSHLSGSAEMVWNKSTHVQNDGGSNTKYPTVKAVKDYVDQATMGVALQATVDGKADKNSPTFTGTPVLPTGTVAVTQTAGDNSTNLATTAFVTSALQNYLPKMTSNDRNSINSPSGGLMIWNTTHRQLEIYDGSHWVNMMGSLVSSLNVGDSYGGGKVAYIFTQDDPGYVAGQTHGLIAANADQTTEAGVKWFNSTFFGSTGTYLGLGLANTISIIREAGNAPLSNYAAGLAYSCRDGGYTDWYLPSKDELNKLYQNRVNIGGFATSGYPTYWSSSQKGTSSFSNFNSWINGISNAWVQFFYTGINQEGTQTELGKDNTRRVRAVRTF